MGDLQLRISNYVRRGISKQQMCKLLDISYIQLMDYLEQFNLIKEQEKEEILVNKIKELLKIKTIDQIAIELGVNYQYLKNKIHFISQNTIKEDIMDKVRWTKEEEDLLIKLRNEGKSYEEISKKIGKPTTALSKKWSKMNILNKITNKQGGEITKISIKDNELKIEKSPKSKFKVAYTKEDDEQILALRAKNVSYKDIAKQLGRNSGDVIYARHYVLNGNKSPIVKTIQNPVTIQDVKIPETKIDYNKQAVESLKKSVDEVKVEQVRNYQTYTDISLDVIKTILESGRKAVIIL